MNCADFALLLDAPWEELTDVQKQEMEQHARECEECAFLWQLRQDMHGMDAVEEVPQEFSSGWRELIKKEEQREMKDNVKKFPWRKILATAAAVTVVAGGTLLSFMNGWGLDTPRDTPLTSARQYSMTSEDYGYATGDTYMLKSAEYDAASLETANAAGQASKIIRTVNFTMRTQQYDADYAMLREKAEEFGGRVESLSISGDQGTGTLRRANLTLRIPSDQLDAFLDSLNGVGSMASYSEYSEDVSGDYYDVQSRLDTQLAKMERLEQLMQQADTMADLIELESAISDTQYMIDSYTGQLNNYDSRVNDSYVYVTLREVSNADAAGEKALPLGERIVKAFEASMELAGELAQSAAVFVVVALPWGVGLAALIVLVKLVRHAVRGKKNKGK